MAHTSGTRNRTWVNTYTRSELRIMVVYTII